jgi:transcriptional regulator with XRE-family HTH domain
MSPRRRAVRFDVTLRRLVAGPSGGASRKRLARAIGVNEATISHYLHGRIRPRFETLVAIAEYFDVSLDYLVFGERAPTVSQDESALLRAQVRQAVVEAADLGGRHLDLVTRITRRLQASVEDAARGVALDEERRGPVGFVTDAEAIGMEACAARMRVMTRTFRSYGHDGRPGVYFAVLVSNLQLGRPYECLLYGDREHWQGEVETFRRLVERSGVPAEASRDCLRFRTLDEEPVASVSIVDLNVEVVERREPILWERYRDDVSPAGVWAYLSVERPGAAGGIALEPLYLHSALRRFQRDWAAAAPL